MATNLKAPFRCFYFDDDGQRIKRTKHHPSACRFVHPSDPEWDSTPTSKYQQRTPGSTSKYSSYRDYRDRDSRSRSPRRRSRSRSRSPYRSPGRPQHPATSSDARLDSPRTSFYRPRANSDVSLSPGAPMRQPVPPPPPLFSAHPVPLLPPSTSTLPLPPPLPATLNGFNAATAPTPAAATTEGMKVMWDKVLPLMADCVSVRQAHQDAQKNLRAHELLLQTPRFATLTPADQELADRQRAELQKALDEKHHELTSTLNLLKETNWWPVGPGQDENAASKYQELIHYAQQLNTTATTMYHEYTLKVGNAPASQSPPSQAAVDIPQDPNARPLKRRRVSDAADDAPVLNADDIAELTGMLDKVDFLEGRVKELDNEFITLESTIIEAIDEKFVGILLESEEEPPSVRRVAQSVDKLGQAMATVNQDIDPLRTESENLRKEMEELEREREQQAQELTKMQQQLAAHEEASEKDQQTMEALSRALKELQTRPPPTPPSLPLEFILTAIDGPIRDSVRSVVQPIVDEMSKDIKGKIDQQDEETYGQLWGKIALTLRVVDAVSKVTPGVTPEPVS